MEQIFFICTRIYKMSPSSNLFPYPTKFLIYGKLFNIVLHCQTGGKATNYSHKKIFSYKKSITKFVKILVCKLDTVK